MATQGRAEYRGMALCAALYGTVLAAVVALSGPRDGPAEIVLQVTPTALAALAFVTAEALWAMRPWAYRAARALAVGTVGVMVLPALAAMAMGEVAVALGSLLPALCVAFRRVSDAEISPPSCVAAARAGAGPVAPAVSG